HLVATHATWLNYMRNSGVNIAPPKGSGLLLATKGSGKDLGNGHLTTDNPNYRGRPVARWISVYGEEAKADIDAIRAELVARQGFAAWRDVPWNDLSRGMARNDEQLDTDEGHLRVFWRRWSELMEQAA